MTPTQISALFFLILSAALLYWLGYRNGLADGRKHQPEPSTRSKAA